MRTLIALVVPSLLGACTFSYLHEDERWHDTGHSEWHDTAAPDCDSTDTDTDTDTEGYIAPSDAQARDFRLSPHELIAGELMVVKLHCASTLCEAVYRVEVLADVEVLAQQAAPGELRLALSVDAHAAVGPAHAVVYLTDAPPVFVKDALTVLPHD